MIDGSIARLGSQYLLGLCARNCQAGDTLAQEQEQAAGKDEVVASLGRAASRFTTRVRDSLATLEKPVPLEEGTTPSLEALKSFTKGWKIEETTGQAAAVGHYQRAIALDLQFAKAYAALGFVYYNTGQTDLAAQYTRKAYELRARASEIEQLFIAYTYHRPSFPLHRPGIASDHFSGMAFLADVDFLAGWQPSGSVVGDLTAAGMHPQEANPICVDPRCIIGDNWSNL